jgi:hypothetical protein
MDRPAAHSTVEEDGSPSSASPDINLYGVDPNDQRRRLCSVRISNSSNRSDDSGLTAIHP